MAAATEQETTWYGILQQTLKRNEVRLVPYVPDQIGRAHV